LPALCLLLAQVTVPGADRRPNGQAIYRQLCVKCHGKNGEGVKDKYNDALHGDWSIEKLTRYIDKNMPEDAPEKCDGPDAEAVSRYIYDAFYSREARARNHPARVELVRLTNRQYLLTVTDLIKRFTGSDTPLTEARGLQASYYNSRRRGGGGTPAFERVDRQVNFDFGTNAPPGLTSITNAVTNGFSIHWRGSVIAEETGEYEFSLKTPNGVRLWVNDEEKPLVDGSVASGAGNEPSAPIRLIGGRAYPLRLEYTKVPYNFKAPKDPTSSIVLQWKPPHGAKQSIPTRNLSPERTTPTFVVATPFPPDDSSVGYERGVSVSKAWDEAATQAGGEVAAHLLKNLDKLSQSAASDTNRAEKVEAFCRDFVEAAFRHPLTEEQKKLFVSVHFSSAPKVEDAVNRVVLLALKSPRFLYLGLNNSKPDDFAAAERLAFGLWDSVPDDELRKLAAQGRLRTREQVTQQARRMLGDARARAKMQYFFQHWLQMNHVEDLSKDPEVYPGFTPEIVSDLRASLFRFLDDVVWSSSSDYRRLLLDENLFVNDSLARFYGIQIQQGEASDNFVKVELDRKQRSGVVTHPYLLAEFSYQKTSSPIHRGVFLTRNIVGRALKSPPMAQEFKDADFSPNLTMREKVAELTRPAACQSCHSVINPLGFSLEQYDAVGRFRAKEGDRLIDVVSDFTTDDGSVVKLKGARDVAEFAAGSRHAQNAFIEQLFHQLVKQPVLAYGSNALNQLRQSFVASEYNVQKLMVEIATLSALHGLEKPAPSRKKS
jgi:hypothetical protein